ncbi:MAG: NlpC/P60 family protein [Paracoccaceae bacterium]
MIDKRRIPARKTVAAMHLKGQVEAEKFVDGTSMQIAVPLLNLTTTADPQAHLATQLLCGEAFDVYDEIPDLGLSWGQAEDGYVGFVATAGLTKYSGKSLTRVTASSALVFEKPDLKACQLGVYSFGCKLHVEEQMGDYIRLFGDVFIPKTYLNPLDTNDYVTIAERFIGVPYLWGGRSFYGLDCSALVQLSLQAIGLTAPRDSDMQADEIGKVVNNYENLQRGDLVFWQGHVGIMRDPETLLHANAHYMAVASESLASAAARIAANGGGGVTKVRRI